MKISAEFERRLAGHEPGSTVQAMLLIGTPFEQTFSSPLGRAAKRKDVQQAISAASVTVLPEIDRVLARFGGRRLADSVDALGALPVETTPEGIRALANAEGVQAIMENQAVSPLY
ncbi:hypothetical protein [Methylocucumis oryzae]|uniref:Uncharacterized protein n=1 Tax=Methylocucumis oryzae TaxID=1632867 RepID=A0A0F3IJH1_9GAMM|nr:hypothetical protein [Methylocucumis oryzae]KJV06822.1 hypothetical protein VZ94_08750 [Methylocucumis oryzae]